MARCFLYGSITPKAGGEYKKFRQSGLRAIVQGVDVSAGIKSTNCPPTTNVNKKHYRSI
ncbi:MAG: hypothetical protein N2747_09385 [Chitinophagaceae bacterium]|nr:hypothetical protein [Chitinophagaceae bacterium]